MESQEILNAVEEATTPLGMERPVLTRETRFDFNYSDDQEFEKPVVIRGTNKFLVPSDHTISFIDEEECGVQEVIDMCRNVDDNLDIATIENVSSLRILFLNNDYMILHDDVMEGGSGLNYCVPTFYQESKKESAAFRKWSELMKIPYSYSKKNPGHLNVVNFEYWKKALTVAQEQQIPIDIVYLREPIGVDLQIDDIDADGPIQAFLVVNILRSQVVCEKRGIITEVIKSKLSDRVPLMSKILENVTKEFKNINPELKISVQQYSLGYTGVNRGRHYARLVLNIPNYSFEVDGDIMHPSISIETDFLGRHKDFGIATVSFNLFRGVCSNGVVVEWNEGQKEQMKDQFVLQYLKNRGINEHSVNYQEAYNSAITQFNAVFSANGINIPVNVANSVFTSTLFKQMFEFFLNTLGYMKDSLEGLTVKFLDEVSEKEFVSTVHNLAVSMKFPPNLIKFLIIEYIAGNCVNQNQLFKTPLDILNFLTYLAKSFESKIQLEVERKAYRFVYNLMQILIYKKKSDDAVYQSYTRQVNMELLRGY